MGWIVAGMSFAPFDLFYCAVRALPGSIVPFFFFQAEDGIRDLYVTGVQTCALPICRPHADPREPRTAVRWRRGWRPPPPPGGPGRRRAAERPGQEEARSSFWSTTRAGTASLSRRSPGWAWTRASRTGCT